MSNIKPPIQTRAIEKKIRLIESARTVFNSKGYHNTHIKDITSDAGISTGLFYKYFNNKDEIYIEVINSMIKKEMDIFTDFKARIVQNENVAQSIKMYIENRLEAITHKRIIEEFYILNKENKDIQEILINARSIYLNELEDMLYNVLDNPTKLKVQSSAIIIWSTLYINIMQVDNIYNLDLKNEYINNLCDLLAKYIN